jgi:hypothetical protein
MSARILTCTEAEYFRDPCIVPSLSQSIAHTLVSKSPAHAFLRHPRLGKTSIDDDDPTPAKDAGKTMHKLLLGKGADIEVVVADDYRTKAAQQVRDMARSQGKVPMIEHKFEQLRGAADVLRKKLADRGYAFSGDSEVAFEWEEQGAHGPVLCRGRMDHVILDQATIYDVKKIESAHPDTCAAHIYDYGYDIQWAAYVSALRKFLGQPDLLVDMVFLFVEVDPPYAITPVNLRECGAFTEIGAMRWSRAVGIWERCLARNDWPEYCDRPVQLEPKPWHMQKEIGSGNW